MKNTNSRNQFFIALLLALGAVGFFGAILYFSRQEAMRLYTTKEAYKAEAAREGARILLKNQLVSLREEHETLSGYFFNKQNVNGLINALEALGEPSRVSVVTEKVMQTEGKDGSLSLALVVEGSQSGIVSYIEDLERAPYLLSLDSFTLVRSERPGTWVARTVISVLGYEGD